MAADPIADIVTLTQLVLHERQGRDRGRWDQMRECLAADARVALSWFHGTGAEFVEASARMAAGGTPATHRLGPAVVDVGGDRALIEIPAAIELRDELDGVQIDLASYARLLYRAERRDGRWWLVALDPIYERDTIQPVVPGTTVHIDPSRLSGFREPYQLLAYVLTAKGFPIADDLCGEDRPDQVAALYAEAYAWLAGGQVAE